jgi:adenosine deaminase CECR1
MVGDPKMTIHGWKQLAEWSLEHACLDDEQLRQAQLTFLRDWDTFCKWIVDTYEVEVSELPELM